MANQIASKKLDDKVIITMLLLSILFLGITAFRYNNKVKCKDVKFGYTAPNASNFPFVNDVIYFYAEIGNYESWEWDFGDKSPVDKKSGTNVAHQYKASGDYIVKLTINGECQGTQNIRINARNEGGRSLNIYSNLLSYTKVNKGVSIQFVDSTIGATNWMWVFGDGQPQYGQSVTKTFNEVGIIKAELVLNGDYEHNRQSVNIEVVDKPLPVTPNTSTIVRPPVVNRSGSTGKVNINPTPAVPANPEDDFSGNTNMKTAESPVIEDDRLSDLILHINDIGVTAQINQYCTNRSINSCSITFNGKPISNVEQLKANVKYYIENGVGVLTVKQRNNKEKKYIEGISVTAPLKPDEKKGFGPFKTTKKYRYPFPN
jgi:PKD repeat protein